MIISRAVDVEVFPNMFSITFVDMKSYLSTFSDCVNEKGKPIPLTEKLTVAEIKRRLDTVKSKELWISDNNDSQLLEMVAYINGMESYYKNITNDDGQVSQIPVRCDCFGFNNQGYDDYMIKFFMMNFNRYDDTKSLIKALYMFNKKIIDLQNNKEVFYADKQIELVRSYRLPYATIDLQKVYGLHSASVVTDKDGNRNKFGKSLKQTSINLKWHELLDFKLPPIDEEEFQLYYSKIDSYKRMTLEQINQVITNDFDRYVLDKYIEPMLYYNKNDVFLVCEMARQSPDEIKLRYSISSAFKVNVLSSSRANIADKLIVKFYSDMSGLHPSAFKDKRTERTRLSFKRIIFPHIKFKTKELQDMLEDMKKISIYRTNKDSFSKEITFMGTTYTLATGGIHSVDKPGILKSTDSYLYYHHDYSSYYPSIMISYDVHPEHLNSNVFKKMVAFLRDTRVEAKHTKDEVKIVLPSVPNKITAEALKIVINTIYGKLGSEMFFLYDRLAQMQVTINGQLMTMTLIEELELNGIHVVSANTDGIVIKLPVDKKDLFKEITERWNETNKMGADGEAYKMIVSRDINNYFDIQLDGKVEYKGALDPLQYRKNYAKGYDMPIVAKAVYEYFANNIPIMTTLRNHKDILDFCKTQNVGRQFEVVYDKVIDGKIVTIHSQRHVRFYVAQRGVVIQKEHVTTHDRFKLASGLPVIILNSLDDKPIEERGINYGYYYEEAMKIINPIKLGISPNQKGNKLHGTATGKLLLQKRFGLYNDLFDETD